MINKKQYLDFGKKYLKLKNISERITFSNNVLSKIPKQKYKIFESWIKDVELHRSHKSTMNKSDEYYLKRLDSKLTGEKTIKPINPDASIKKDILNREKAQKKIEKENLKRKLLEIRSRKNK
jgi:hypothetical protein